MLLNLPSCLRGCVRHDFKSMSIKSKNDPGVEFLYGNAFGRILLKIFMKSHMDRLVVRYLKSGLSKGMVRSYAKKHDIPLNPEQLKAFRSFREFFIRSSDNLVIDTNPRHLISPCDGYLSAFRINEDSSFSIKASQYRISELLQDEELAKTYQGGTCLIFRLCASDYHHYCYIDNGRLGQSHEIPGVLHSVQPIVCEKLPVFVLNKRCWTLLETENFGLVVQTEIGALIVGGIVNNNTDIFRRGEEKGRFELAGSTIVLLFQKDRMRLSSEITDALKSCDEVRVAYGSHIGFSE